MLLALQSASFINRQAAALGLHCYFLLHWENPPADVLVTVTLQLLLIVWLEVTHSEKVAKAGMACQPDYRPHTCRYVDCRNRTCCGRTLRGVHT